MSIALPKTSESTDTRTMRVGLNRARILDIDVWRKDMSDLNSEAKKDNRGYPGAYITFVNEHNETIGAGFYYSDKPLDHPSREDDNLKCKSEYFLFKVRRAFGLKGSDDMTVESLKSKWIFVPVALKIYVDKNSNQVMNQKGNPKQFHEIVKDFYPDGEPVLLAGDPIHTKAEKPDGMFKIVEVDFKAKAAPKKTSATSETVEQTETKTADGTDMDVEEEDF